MKRFVRVGAWLVLAIGFVFSSPAFAGHWVGSWASAQQAPAPKDVTAPEEFHDASVRQIVHLSVGGNRLRLRLSNLYGTQPLVLAGVHVARAHGGASSVIDPASDRVVRFDGQGEVIIPAGAEYYSDPVALAVPAQADLAVTVRYEQPPAGQTGHSAARATTYFVHGNHLADAELVEAKKFDRWYQLAAIEVAAPGAAVVVFGDSITDGHGATVNGNDRWPDQFAARLQKALGPRAPGVLNLGIGGNRLLNDGMAANALARFEHDVLTQSGVRTVILLEGINDIGTLTKTAPATPAEHEALVARMIGAYRQLAARAHDHGLRILAGTILPFMGSDYYHPTEANEADRREVNHWLRTSGAFDGVVDFDQLMRDPAHPERLNPVYDYGDHLHPSPAGYRVMAEGVDLRLVAGPGYVKSGHRKSGHRK
jgi:lysophospholipase L1-like esterase